jgi:hypothetical protein
MRNGNYFILVGLVLIAFPTTIALTTSGSCPSVSSPASGFLTGCAWVDQERIEILVFAIVGLASIVTGFLVRRKAAQASTVAVGDSQSTSFHSAFSFSYSSDIRYTIKPSPI